MREDVPTVNKMSAEQVAAAASTVAEKKKKKKTTTSNHPPTSEMVDASISTLKERGGSSVAAIKKHIAATYKVDVAKLAPFIKKYIKGAVVKGHLLQTKGKGASGSFKLSAAKKPKKSAAAASVKPKAAKKPASEKKIAAKKPAAKKSVSIKLKPAGTAAKPADAKKKKSAPKAAAAAKKQAKK